MRRRPLDLGRGLACGVLSRRWRGVASPVLGSEAFSGPQQVPREIEPGDEHDQGHQSQSRTIAYPWTDKNDADEGCGGQEHDSRNEERVSSSPPPCSEDRSSAAHPEAPGLPFRATVSTTAPRVPARDRLSHAISPVRLHGNERDAARGFNRTENVRPIPPSDADFPSLYARRNDAESINRGVDDSMYLRRAHSFGHARQHVNLLGYALLVNSLALLEHVRRRPHLSPAA